MQNYDYWEHNRAACQRCELGDVYSDPRNFDQRFTQKICDELDMIERQEWSEFAKTQQEQLKRVDLTLLTKNMTMLGSRERTPNEEREVQLRKEEADSF